MEHAIRFRHPGHKLIQSVSGTRNHVIEIRSVEANAFRLSGSSRGVDDGDEIFAPAADSVPPQYLSDPSLIEGFAE